MNDTTLGIIAAAVPLIIIGFFALRRLPWIFAFFVALVAVGLGYLQTTGAMRDFGHEVRTVLPAGMLPEHKKTEEAAPAEGGAMKALPPPAEPAPTPPAAESSPTPPATPAPEATPPSPPAAEQAPATPPATPAPEATPSTPSTTEPATPPAAPAPTNP
ncbi:MAG: hypothetical protein JSR78_14715 [Proteobacteria bacterium]|nr:hypothetical protein [Pseudomonadota bacterium]